MKKTKTWDEIVRGFQVFLGFFCAENRMADREQKLALARKKLERFQSNRNPVRNTAPSPPVDIIPIQSTSNSIPVQQQPIINTISEPQPPSTVNNISSGQTDTISLLIDEKKELLDIQEKLSMALCL